MNLTDGCAEGVTLSSICPGRWTQVWMLRFSPFPVTKAWLLASRLPRDVVRRSRNAGVRRY